MNFERTSRTGGPFGSVALRYRQPLCAGLRSGRRYSWQVLSGDPAGDDLAARGPNARTPRVARLEAALLLSQQPQSSRRLAQLAGLADGTKARTLVRALNRLLDSEGCAFRAEEVAGGFQLLSRSKFAPWLRGQRSTPPEVRLSAPAMETLAVVAYRQPVVRAEIEAVRGVLCGEILRQLIERGLVRIAGRAEELGRPFLYGTTKHFLQVFGLRHLDELPRPELFRAEGASKADNELSDQHDDIEEETDVRSTTAVMGQMEQTPEETPAAPLQESEDELFDHDEEDDDEDDEDDLDEDEDDDDLDEDDDEGFEEDQWEEVDDEELDEDEDIDEEEEEEEEDEREDEDEEELDEDEDLEEDDEEDWEEEEEEEEE